jgi:hypothetical protein
MFFRLPAFTKVQRLHLSYYAYSPSPEGVRHGPQTWPWWRLLGIRVYKLQVHFPTTGKAIWVYTRWKAFNFTIVFDRRVLGF